MLLPATTKRGVRRKRGGGERAQLQGAAKKERGRREREHSGRVGGSGGRRKKRGGGERAWRGVAAGAGGGLGVEDNVEKDILVKNFILL